MTEKPQARAAIAARQAAAPAENPATTRGCGEFDPASAPAPAEAHAEADRLLDEYMRACVRSNVEARDAIRAQLRAALAARPQAPLSERAILDLVPSNMPLSNDFELLWFARAVERAHGIHAQKWHGPGYASPALRPLIESITGEEAAAFDADIDGQPQPKETQADVSLANEGNKPAPEPTGLGEAARLIRKTGEEE